VDEMENKKSAPAKQTAGLHIHEEEQPTEAAQLMIVFVPVASGRRPWNERMGRWLLRRISPSRETPANLSADLVPDRAGGQAEGADVPGARGDAFITALYLEAEKTRLLHEPSFDTDRGLQRFNAWLDGQIEPSA
jgi:hypothetical protein